MPWIPELFTAPGLQQRLEQEAFETVPYFEGLLTGEMDALVGSFAGEPQLHDPVRGRIKGTDAFTAYVEEMRAWLIERDVSVETVEHVATDDGGFGEAVLRFDGARGRVARPHAVVADRRPDRRIEELRIYYGGPLENGRHARRPPLLQRDGGLRAPEAVAEYERALAAGDVDAIVAAFEADGSARGAAGGVHRGPDDLRAFYGSRLSDGGGIALEHCAIVAEGQRCALEYNVVRSPPEAGLAVYVIGPSGRLAAARIYDDA